MTSLQLVAPRFTAVQPTPKTTTVEPGGRPGLTPIDDGEVVCAHGTVGPATLAVTVQIAGGVQETVLPVGSAGEVTVGCEQADSS